MDLIALKEKGLWLSQLSEQLKLAVLNEVNGKKGKQIMIFFTVIDELGNGYACQMWPDDP